MNLTALPSQAVAPRLSGFGERGVSRSGREPDNANLFEIMNKKNTLEEFCEEIGMDPIEAMNLLQESNIVSSNCVTIHDVCDTDCVAAIRFLDGILG